MYRWGRQRDTAPLCQCCPRAKPQLCTVLAFFGEESLIMFRCSLLSYAVFVVSVCQCQSLLANTGVNRTSGSAGSTFMMVAGISAKSEMCLTMSGAEVGLEPCLAAIAAGDGLYFHMSMAPGAAVVALAARLAFPFACA